MLEIHYLALPSGLITSVPLVVYFKIRIKKIPYYQQRLLFLLNIYKWNAKHFQAKKEKQKQFDQGNMAGWVSFTKS